MLEVAKEVNLDNVIIIGFKGDNFYFTASHERNSDILWDLKQAELTILIE